MSSENDYYSVLGVPRDADISEIKKAYKRLARKYHPDVAEDKSEAERKMGEINEAYGVLGDEEKRAYYDRFGAAPGAHGAPGGEGFGGFGGGFPFGDIFESLFNMGGRGQDGPARGRDIRVGLKITLEEAFTGCKKDITYEVDETCLNCQGKMTTEPGGAETCKTCGGAGQVRKQVNIGFGSLSQVVSCPECGGLGKKITKPCPECHGHGIVRNKKTVEVSVPAGVESGLALRISGKGEPGYKGGPSGNLLVIVEVEEHESFRREGDELVTTRRLKFTEAALGCEIEVDLISGAKHKLKIPAGTQSGSVFRIAKKGMPHLGRTGFGDLHVIVDVMVPTKLNNKQKKLLQEFAEAGSQIAETRHNESLLGRIKDAIFG